MENKLRRYHINLHFKLETAERVHRHVLEQIKQLHKLYGGKVYLEVNYGIQSYHGISAHYYKVYFYNNVHGVRQFIKMLNRAKAIQDYTLVKL